MGGNFPWARQSRIGRLSTATSSIRPRAATGAAITYGRPVHRFLGGAYRDRVRVYASAIMPNTPAEGRALVARHVEQGYTAVTLGWGPSATSRNS